MANLSITNLCNNKCKYCFANDAKTELGKTVFDKGTFRKALDYLERSGLKQVRLLGGEPTLHPDFASFVSSALDRDFDIMLFTNGLISSEILDFLASIPSSRLSILLNTIHPGENNTKGMYNQLILMERLGPVIIAGVNIYSAKLDLDYLLDYIVNYNLKKEIRMGLAHPVLSQQNVYLHPKEYHKVGWRIALFKLKAQQHGICFGFDCGFVPCMFPDEYLELLGKELKKAGTCCHPVIDLLADGSFIACYPLNNLLKIRIHDNLSIKDLLKDFETALLPYKDIGIFPHCTSCSLFGRRCNGGCMAHRIMRFSGCSQQI
jgi:MoaA/NifB/PqqE/SkfB family radical SAM enzyme